ncbi:MAG: hypothetical protein KAH20_00890 [Methylococcales bacterium]|nr:hypothetical protein [Methylococcales bacterium]
MYKKTISKTIKKMIIVPIGVALSLSSIQVSASQPDQHGPNKLCFHIAPTPHLPDPEGSYIAVRLHKEKALNVNGAKLKLREARGMAISRADISGGGSWGEWVGTPLTGTCHKHHRKVQCSFHSISSISSQLPLPLEGTSVTTGTGHLTFVHNLNDKKTIMSQDGAVNVSYFDVAGNPIPDNLAPLPTFKKIKNIITNAEKVKCKTVPHPGIPDFSIQ